MKYTFETDDDLEAKRMITAKDLCSCLHNIRELLFKTDDDKLKDAICETIDDYGINIDELWP